MARASLLPPLPPRPAPPLSLLLLLLLQLAAAPSSRAQPAPPMVASPPSTLLPPGATSLPLQLRTSQSTDCRWDSADVPYASMRNAFATDGGGGGGTAHSTTLTGLSGGLELSAVYVQCAAFAAAGAPLALSYRSLPDSGNAPFPRLGNLWGSSNFRGHPEGLAYAARRSSLWLGSDWSAAEIAELRALNPYTIALTSINACETNDQNLPDAFYLTNITQPASTKGRLESWPGAWRLDLTNPDVQQYQAQLMYCLTVWGGSGYGPHPGCSNNASAAAPPLVFDGLFVDNVFMDDGAAVNSQDIYHNPFIPLDRATGRAMVDFGDRWKSGMVSMIAQFRALMPDALLDGHAMDIADGNISAQFNAISIGFTTPEIVERRTTFASGLAMYNAWMTVPARSPKVTMVESAVRFQLGYGYGFNTDLATLISPACENSNSVPGAPMPGIGDACVPTQQVSPGYMLPQTWLFARSEFQYFRFGLGFTLMRDGYFSHELGDSWHGMDWDYDEIEFRLGLALGNASVADVLNPDLPPVPPDIPLTEAWSLYVRSPSVSNASWALDEAVRPSPDAPASARVDVQNSAASNDGIDISQVVDGFARVGAYALIFWARASRDNTPVQLNSRKNGGDWHNFGLDASVVFTTTWALYNVSFDSSGDGTQGRLSWFVGSAAPNTSLWINSPSLKGVAESPPVLIREFECGAVVLNGDTNPSTVQLPAGLRRLSGLQAPLWQYVVDDGSSAFKALTGQWGVVDFDSGYNGAQTPSQEEVRPANGYFHHWQFGASLAPAGSSAAFNLSIPVSGVYNVSMWWPAAVPARSAWAQAMRVSISPGGVSTTVDLSSQGGDLFLLVAAEAQLEPSSTLVVECPAGGGACVADAVLVESAARYNDGSAAAQVTLGAMDAVVLERASAPPNCGARRRRL